MFFVWNPEGKPTGKVSIQCQYVPDPPASQAYTVLVEQLLASGDGRNYLLRVVGVGPSKEEALSQAVELFRERRSAAKDVLK